MKITVKKHEDVHYLDLNDFKDIIDISKVEYYEMVDMGDGALTLAFYDKDKNLIMPKDLSELDQNK